VCARYGIEVFPPADAERKRLHSQYVGELLASDFRDSTRAEVVALVTRLRDAHQLDGVILGGTELPLLLRSPIIADLPTLDTTALHVDAIVQRLRSGA
jgi:aspartate racemase